MPPEAKDETAICEKIQKTISEQENIFNKEDESESPKMETESCVSITINNHASERDDNVSFPAAKKFFTKHKDAGECSQVDKKNLIHIIKIFPGYGKKNDVKVEEIFERSNKNKSLSKKKPQMKGQNKSCSSKEKRSSPAFVNSTANSVLRNRENSPFSCKSHPNSRIIQEKNNFTPIKSKRKSAREIKEKFLYSQTESNITNKNIRKTATGVRPYMLDAKARREIRDYDHYLYRPNSINFCKNTPSCTSNKRFPGKQNKNFFEVKFISLDFGKYSGSSAVCNTSEISLSSSEARKKFQNEPKIENDRIVEEKGKIEDLKNINLFTTRRPPGSPSVIDKLKGDDRDLPEIYSRFVRRSKGIFRREFNNKNYIEKKEFEIDQEPESEIDKQKRIIDEHLELIEKNPYKLKNKLKDNVKRVKPELKNTEKEDKINEMKNRKSIESKEKQTASPTKSDAVETKKFKKKNKNHFPGNRIRKNSRINNDTEKNMENPIIESNRNKFKSKKVVEENLHMSPTAAMTMMLLATEKIIAKKSEFFQKLKGASGIKI